MKTSFKSLCLLAAPLIVSAQAENDDSALGLIQGECLRKGDLAGTALTGDYFTDANDIVREATTDSAMLGFTFCTDGGQLVGMRGYTQSLSDELERNVLKKHGVTDSCQHFVLREQTLDNVRVFTNSRTTFDDEGNETASEDFVVGMEVSYSEPSLNQSRTVTLGVQSSSFVDTEVSDDRQAVGFYGSADESGLNSLGVLYHDTACRDNDSNGVPEEEYTAELEVEVVESVDIKGETQMRTLAIVVMILVLLGICIGGACMMRSGSSSGQTQTKVIALAQQTNDNEAAQPQAHAGAMLTDDEKSIRLGNAVKGSVEGTLEVDESQTQGMVADGDKK